MTQSSGIDIAVASSLMTTGATILGTLPLCSRPARALRPTTIVIVFGGGLVVSPW